MSQLRKLAQNYPTQETGGGGDLGDIDEDDEVPGMSYSAPLLCLVIEIAWSSSLELVGNFDEPSKSEV